MEIKKRKRRTGKKARRNRIIVILSGVLAVFAVVLVGAMMGWLFIGDNKTPEQEQAEQEKKRERPSHAAASRLSAEKVSV